MAAAAAEAVAGRPDLDGSGVPAPTICASCERTRELDRMSRSRRCTAGGGWAWPWAFGFRAGGAVGFGVGRDGVGWEAEGAEAAEAAMAPQEELACGEVERCAGCCGPDGGWWWC